MPEDRPVRRSLLAAAADGIRESMTDALTKEGRGGVGAPAGREVLGLLEPRPYDLVLSDLRMPDVDGPSLYETLRTRHHFPVRFTTAPPRDFHDGQCGRPRRVRPGDDRADPGEAVSFRLMRQMVMLTASS